MPLCSLEVCCVGGYFKSLCAFAKMTEESKKLMYSSKLVFDRCDLFLRGDRDCDLFLRGDGDCDLFLRGDGDRKTTSSSAGILSPDSNDPSTEEPRP